MSYASQIALALRLITDKGTSCTLQHYPAGVPARDRLNETISATVPTAYTGVKIVVLLDKPKSGYTDTEANTDTRGRSRRFLIAGASCPVLPQTPDVIQGPEGRQWSIKQCSPLAPDGGPVIVYKGVMES